MLVFETRPEAIKMGPLVKKFQKYLEEFETIVYVTGQHREMLDQELRIFDVKTDFVQNNVKHGRELGVFFELNQYCNVYQLVISVLSLKGF